MEPKGKRIIIKKNYSFEFYMPTPGWQVYLPLDVGWLPWARDSGAGTAADTQRIILPLTVRANSLTDHSRLDKALALDRLLESKGKTEEGQNLIPTLDRNGRVGNSHFISQNSWTVWAPRLPIPDPELQIQGAGACDSFLFHPGSPNLSHHWPRSETN